MSEVIYLKLKQSNQTNKRDVFLGDVAQVYGPAKLVPKVRAIKLASFQDKKKERKCFSVIDVIEKINQLDESVEVQSVGECDFIIEYSRPTNVPAGFKWLLVALVCFITFFGSAYGIMAYNNDVGTIEIFEKIYELMGASHLSEKNIIEIAYAIGLFVGIVVFYDHFAGHKITKDPTPIEVAMNQYETDMNTTIIDTKSSKFQYDETACGEEMPKCVQYYYGGSIEC